MIEYFLKTGDSADSTTSVFKSLRFLRFFPPPFSSVFQDFWFCF